MPLRHGDRHPLLNPSRSLASWPVPRNFAILGSLFAAVALPAAAHAQFVTSGADLDEPAGEAVTDTAYRGRVSTTGVLYDESSDALVDPVLNVGDDPASGQTILYGDLRGRIEAAHIQGGKWDAVGDFRLRLPADELSARGWLGGSESDLREAYFLRRGKKTDLALGRLILRDLDASTVDGVKLIHRPSRAFELGAFAGLYPNPFSRSLSTDYVPDRAPQDMPAATGAWGGYRTATAHGSIGVAGIFPQDDEDAPDPDPTRAFATASGYWRARPGVDLFHYLVVDLVGRGGTQLMNAQLGLHWRASDVLVVEAGASHMSTYAIELYLRDYLEAPDTPTPGRVQNNLFIARMASDEGRLGATYLVRKQRVDVYGQVRYRSRGMIASDDLPAEIADLPPDTQLDVSGGVRQRRSIAGLDLGLSFLYIDGDRTSTQAVTARVRRGFLDDRIDVDLDATYLAYSDTCAFAPGGIPSEANCSGTADGTIVEVGGAAVWRRDKHWLFLADYHYSTNSATARSAAGVETAEPTIVGHTFFARAQYSF
jgi:hypothetical protein